MSTKTSNERGKSWRLLLANQIKAARGGKGLTQGELAEQLGMRRATLSSYETGNGEHPRFETVARIAIFLEAEFRVLGCRTAAVKPERVHKAGPSAQLALEFDKDHSFLATVKIRPTRKSITITAHADHGIRSA